MAAEDKNVLPLIWQKLQIVSSLLASILVPLVIGLVGQSINSSIQEKELELRYIQLSLDILKEPPNKETSNLRDWAVKTLNHYSIRTSGIALGEAAEKDLIKQPLFVSAISAFISASELGFRDGKYFLYEDKYGSIEIGFEHKISADERASELIEIAGQSIPYKEGLTQTQAQQLLDQDLEPLRASIDELVTVPLTDSQKEALALFVHNVGIGGFRSSTLLRLLNQGDYDAVEEQLRRWDRSGGVVSLELRERREKEIELWNQQ